MGFLGVAGTLGNVMKIGKPANRTNWFMFDLSNKQLISLTTAPETVSDTKGTATVEVSVPGGAYKPVLFSSLENKKIAFTIRVIARNQVLGNQVYIQQFDALRHPQVGLFSIFADKTAFTPNPKVLYHYGTGTAVPLVYFVSIAMEHSLFNNWGYPQITDVTVELILDEDNLINQAETVTRKIAMIAGTVQGAGSMVAGMAGVRKKTY